MIVVIDDATFAEEITPSLVSAVQSALAAAQLGLHRVLVSPVALEIAEAVAPELPFLQGLRIAQGGWVEGNAMARLASRVLVLTANPDRRSHQEENRYFVHCDDVEERGLFREPSVVMESMATDAKWLKICMRAILQLSSSEFRRYWHAKPEQGGGSTLFNFVHRYADDDPNPMAIVVDRDANGEPPRHSTADKVLRSSVSKGIFADRNTAHAGGFSSSMPNISIHVLNCWSIENLIFPKVMEIFFNELANGIGDTSRRETIVRIFPSFPDIANDRAEDWLFLKFKNNPTHGGGSIFDSGCIDRLIAWIDQNESNYSRFAATLLEEANKPVFDAALRGALRDFWSVGQRLKTLA
ncbi:MULTISPECIES: hypothetical protein [unclassified Caulobacter]|jgi:hypothetical protein|uniref:hypothetical protein n=1 Tax=unclassified Caulobacter TaxID=2648921 RepID=UPI000AEA7F10|nr:MULTISPECIES: hypothetical protein [unclassified Caulobacter]